MGGGFVAGLIQDENQTSPMDEQLNYFRLHRSESEQNIRLKPTLKMAQSKFVSVALAAFCGSTVGFVAGRALPSDQDCVLKPPNPVSLG